MTKQINPKVSIVIPVYNGSNYLKEAIDSALAQTYKKIEVLVINDGSNDKGATEKIALSYGNKIRYFKKENGGVASALNYGIKQMTGDYFSWLSHDDLYEKTKVEDQIDFLNSFPAGNIIIASNVSTLFPSGIKKKEYIDKKTFEYIDIFLATSAHVGLNGCSLLIPRKALINSGGFDINLPVTQDYDLWFRLKDKYKFVLLDKHLVVSRRHDMQDSVQKQKLMLEAGDKLHYDFLNNIAYERFRDYFLDNKVNIKHALRNYNLYKIRGYKKTASLLLKGILRYYYENNIKKFYEVVNSEKVYIFGSKVCEIKYSNKMILLSGQSIGVFYDSIINQIDDTIRKHKVINYKLTLPKPKARGPVVLFVDSVVQDGLYLTIEKIIRKVYTKLISK